jgi:hypothetical protein
MKTPNSLELGGAKVLTKTLASNPTRSQEVPSQSIDLLVQQSLSTGSVAIGTIIAMSLLLREIRLLIQAYKG